MAYETAVAIIGTGILFYLGLMVISTNDEHPMLKLLYILLGLSLMVGLVALAMRIASDNSASVGVINMLSMLLWITSTIGVFVSAYYLYYIVLWVYAKIMSLAGDRKAKRFGERFKT